MKSAIIWLYIYLAGYLSPSLTVVNLRHQWNSFLQQLLSTDIIFFCHLDHNIANLMNFKTETYVHLLERASYKTVIYHKSHFSKYLLNVRDEIVQSFGNV